MVTFFGLANDLCNISPNLSASRKSALTAIHALVFVNIVGGGKSTALVSVVRLRAGSKDASPNNDMQPSNVAKPKLK